MALSKCLETALEFTDLSQEWPVSFHPAVDRPDVQDLPTNVHLSWRHSPSLRSMLYAVQINIQKYQNICYKLKPRTVNPSLYKALKSFTRASMRVSMVLSFFAYMAEGKAAYRSRVQ